MKTLTREEIEQREREQLAPYAARSDESKGRAYPQVPHPLRTDFQRDRDRIIHSAAFRRMEYKTQVFIPHEKDHYRTRLTHTIEVAQISRTLARNLRLNEDLAEAMALVHDVGHTPFGHSGEEVLDDLLAECGGFNHNHQSLRVVELLEQRYADHPGLNLTYEVREGIAKHETNRQLHLERFEPELRPTLEASLVDIADEIAYNAHDIDDGLSSGLIIFETLQEAAFWKELSGEAEVSNSLVAGDQKRYAVVRRLIDMMATDVIKETQRRIARQGVASLSDVRHAADRLVTYSAEMAELVEDLKDFLVSRLYRHPRLTAMSDRARDIISGLYGRISAEPDLMPLRFRKMLSTEMAQIVIADYIAGMTDRYAEQMYKQVVAG